MPFPEGTVAYLCWSPQGNLIAIGCYDVAIGVGDGFSLKSYELGKVYDLGLVGWERYWNVLLYFGIKIVGVEVALFQEVQLLVQTIEKVGILV